MPERKIRDFEILDHGAEHSQYFQGCGTSHTGFEDVATGCGDNAKEAYEDAADILAQMGWDTASLPSRPRGIRQRNKVPARAHEEMHYYVSIRVR
jgi:hypothetical protein